MEEFIEYLQSIKISDPHVQNYPKMITYRVIMSALRDKADTLSLTEIQFGWSKDGEQVGAFTFPIGDSSLRVAQLHFEALWKIMRSDTMVQRYMHVVSESPDEVVCKLAPPQDHG